MTVAARHPRPDSLQPLDHRGPQEVLLLDGGAVRQLPAGGAQAQEAELPPRLLRVSDDDKQSNIKYVEVS